MSDTVGLTDLPASGFRIEVKRAWSGLEMTPTFCAQLLTREDGKRWKEVGRGILNDDGPIAAVSDLLSVLDCGELPR